MQIDILELENILNKEFDIFSELEKNVIEKKKYLIKSDIENLRNVDIEIEKLGILVQDIEFKKSQLLQKSSLSTVIEKIQDKNKAKKLSILREKLKNMASNIYRQNNINAQLIEHSLKLIGQTVKIITDALMPENSAYNNLGQIKKNRLQGAVCSISQEA